MFAQQRKVHLPFHLPHHIVVRQTSPATAYDEIAELYPRVFGNFQALDMFRTPVERRTNQQTLRDVLNCHTEYFLFVNSAEKIIGWSFGTQTDADTYFMQFTGIDPDYQNKGIYTAFLKKLLPYLKSLGYERVISNHLVNNRAVLIAKLKAGFDIFGMSLDERWGAQVELVHHLYPDRHQGYKQTFSLPDYG